MSQPRLNELLQQTSRSFYLTLRVLPRAIRSQIGLAYLLARTTDTIADTELVPVAQRLEALRQLRARILGRNPAPLYFGELARHQGSPAERQLLEQIEAALAALDELPQGDLQLVREVLDTITSGQELDLQRFGGWGENTGEPSCVTTKARADARPTGKQISALQNDAALDDYTYRVAGCVGEFWTRMCCQHLFPRAGLENRLLQDGVRFGKGLQLVNILRDLPADLRQGRCYLPADQLAAASLTPTDLLTPGNEAKFRPLYQRYLDLAEAHLAAGWAYINAIPASQVRVRLACAWPVLIGLKTLQRLRIEPVLDPARRVKISRAEVRGILFQTLWRYPFRASWRALAQISQGDEPGKLLREGENSRK
jgi:farnesyl-diphosphate farnesyltransferase